MVQEREQHEFTLWRSGPWRCEFWVIGRSAHLRVYRGRQLERDHVVVDATRSCAAASAWLAGIERDGSLPAE